MNNHLCVCTGLQGVSSGENLIPQFWKVVDFSVVNDPDGTVLIRDWLLARAKVDDREPAVAEHRLPSDVDPVIIRTTVDNQTHHPANDVRINCGSSSSYCDFSGDSTHKFEALTKCPSHQLLGPILHPKAPTQHLEPLGERRSERFALISA